MFDLILCGVSLSCYFKELKQPKYPPEVAEICSYYEEQKLELPEYCKFDVKPPRRRNEF